MRFALCASVGYGLYHISNPSPKAVGGVSKTNLAGYVAPGGTVAGYTMGSFSVSDGGQAGYSIPIQVSPGTSNIQPTLAMVFGSGTGNTILGKDWAVTGLSVISRSGRTKAQDGYIRNVKVDSLDTYSLDGERLFAISGSYGANGTEYRTERNNFSKVVSYGNYLGCPTSFKVWTKSGLIYEYGNTASSLIEASGSSKAMFWLLNRVLDTKGNYMDFAYGEVNGEYYPTQIAYTGNIYVPNMPTYATVDFVYLASRPDNTERYINGYKIPQTKLLNKIVCKYGNTVVREYRCTYNYGTYNDVSLLASVQECGKNGVCLDPTTFYWKTENKLSFTKDPNNTNILQNLTTHANTLPVSASAWMLTGDWDGDGRQDIMRFDPSNGKNRFYRSTGQNGGFDFSSAYIDDVIAPNHLLDLQPSAVSPNGTGYMAYSNINPSPNTVAASNPYAVMAQDINADGYTDLVVFPVKTTHQNLCNAANHYENPVVGNFGPFDPPPPTHNYVSHWVACQPYPGAPAHAPTTGYQNAYPNPTNDLNKGTITAINASNCQTNFSYSHQSLQNSYQSISTCNYTGDVKKSLTAYLNGTQPCVFGGAPLGYTGENVNGTCCGSCADPNNPYGCWCNNYYVACWEFTNSNRAIPVYPSNKFDYTQNIAACKVYLNNKGSFGGNLGFTETSTTIPANVLCQMGIALGRDNPNQACGGQPCPYNYAYNIDYSNLSFSDFNGDGRSDLFVDCYDGSQNGFNPWKNLGANTPSGCNFTYDGSYPNGQKYHIYLNNGVSGGQWNVNVTYPSLPNYTDSTYSIIPINLNDDNLTDLFYYDKTTGANQLYINQGNGNTVTFAAGLQLINPASITGGEGLEYGDFNADGNTDILWYNSASGQTKFFVNRGNLTFVQQTSGVVMPTSAITKPNTNLSVRDFNSDGYADLYWYDPSNGDNRWFMNKGNWDFTTALNPAQPTQAGYWNPVLAADMQNKPALIEGFSNRGLSDLMTYNIIAGQNNWYRNNIVMYHQMDSIRTGNGASVEIEYAPLTLDSVYEKGTAATYPDYDYRGSFYVVASYSTDDGIGGRNRVKYFYKGARMSLEGRGFRGFKEIRTLDMTSNTTIIKTFEEDYKKGGALKRQQNILDANTASPKLLSDIVYSNKSAPYYFNNNVYSDIQFAYIDSTVSKSYDLDGSLVSTTITANTYNEYGDLTKNIMNFGGGNLDSTVSQYDYGIVNKTNWLLGRMTRADLYRYRGNKSIHRASAFDYELGTGRLIREVTEPDSGALRKITTEYSYNQFGNTIQKRTIAWNGTQTEVRLMNFTFDSKGRYQLTVTNELGHQLTKTYDDGNGLILTETDANGLTTTIGYDQLGRVMYKQYPDGTWEAWDMRKCDASCPPEASYYMVMQQSGETAKRSWYDRLGREVLVQLDGYSGLAAHVTLEKTVYNKRGQIVTETDPYYTGSTPNQTVYQYDTLGRVIRKQVPAPNNIGTLNYDMQYKGLTLTTTNPLGQKHKEIKNTLGQLVAVMDNQNNVVTYEYDAAGNQTKIHHNGISVVSTYDHFGRKTQVFEPHIGTIRYKYNSFGDMLQQIDADNDTINVKYDSLGRMTQRIEKEGTTTWTYDNRPKGIGKVGTLQSPNGYQYEVFFDYVGRVSNESYTIDSSTYSNSFDYDSYGRLSMITYPTGLQIQQEYNARGFLEKVKNPQTNFTYWEATNVNVWGQITNEVYGNGVATTRTYDAGTGWLKQVRSTNTQNADIQNFVYEYNALANLVKRKDQIRNYEENFTYDDLNRLTSATINNVYDVDVSYMRNGNIKTKSDVGTYYYNDPTKPYQLTGIDAAPNTCLPTFQNSVRYHSYQMVKSIRRATDSMTIDYGPSRERIVQKTFQNNQLKEKKIYVSNLYEKEVTDTTIREMVYIRGGGGGVIAVENKRKQLSTNAVTNYTDYWHKDHLGSLQCISNANGQKAAEFNYDPWGRRRNLDGSAQPIAFALNDSRYDRGFTGHEHLSLFGLINMNGRIYDPIIGRFISADPVFEDITDYQSMHRYAYCRNNPLSLTDPSGYFFGKIFHAAKKLVTIAVKSTIKSFKSIATSTLKFNKALFSGNISGAFKELGNGIVSVAEGLYDQVKQVNKWGEETFGSTVWKIGTSIAITMATGGVGAAWGLSGVMATAVSAAAGGFAQGILATASAGGSLGDALVAGLKGAAVSGVMGGISHGIGDIADPYLKGGNYLASAAIKGVGHGVLQGTYQAVSGGNFMDGFKSGMATGAFEGSGLGAFAMNSISSDAGKVIAGAMIGGTASALGGGDFASGAASGAFTTMYNYCSHPFDRDLECSVVRKTGDYNYDSSSGTLTGSDLSLEGYSGNGDGYNNPSMENVKNVGPIPRGCYNVGESFTNAKGQVRTRLEPQFGTEMYGRSGIQIHRGTFNGPRTSSHGCIVLKNNDAVSKIQSGKTLCVF
ncbi:MAG: FG-GAP-like repeat-containing protein [Bacteroidia bacterium]|nr:FG-GAP-like repeat-containing protein [Bacteroidia bacterium]